MGGETGSFGRNLEGKAAPCNMYPHAMTTNEVALYFSVCVCGGGGGVSNHRTAAVFCYIEIIHLNPLFSS